MIIGTLLDSTKAILDLDLAHGLRPSPRVVPDRPARQGAGFSTPQRLKTRFLAGRTKEIQKSAVKEQKNQSGGPKVTRL
jgi:hypothetical protein